MTASDGSSRLNQLLSVPARTGTPTPKRVIAFPVWYANYPNLGTAETYEPAKRVVRSRYGLPLAIPYLVMFTKGPLHVPITSGSVVGGVTWGYVMVLTYVPARTSDQ